MATFKRIAQPDPTAELDAICKAKTAFGSFAELTDGTHVSYRPTIFCDNPANVRLADAYDLTMAERGDSRRAFRAGLNKPRRRRTR